MKQEDFTYTVIQCAKNRFLISNNNAFWISSLNGMKKENSRQFKAAKVHYLFIKNIFNESRGSNASS